MKKTQIRILVSFLAICWAAIATAQQMKSVEYKERKLPDPSAQELWVMQVDYKEYNNGGREIKRIISKLNPGGEIVKASSIDRSWNDKGKLEARKIFDEMGDLIKEEKIQFNKKNKKLEEEYKDILKNPNETFTRKYEYTDDPKPKPLATELLNSKGKTVGSENWKYNKEGEEIRYKKWENRTTGKYEEEKKTFYNKDGTLNKAEKIIKDGDKELKEVTVFEGYKVKESFKYENGELVSQFGGAGNKTKFDPSKNRTMMDFSGGGGGGGFGGGGFGGGGFGGFGMYDSEEEVDDQGRKTKITDKTPEGEIVQVIEYAYDKHGNTTKIKTTRYEGGEEAGNEEEVSEFDDNNNLLRKAKFINNTLITEDLYVYQYY